MLAAGVGKRFNFNTSSTFDSAKPQERPGIQYQAAALVVHVFIDMDTSSRDQLLCTRIPNNSMLKDGGKRLQPSFNIRENKRNVEWLLKRRLNVLNSFIIDSTCFNTVEEKGDEGGEGGGGGRVDKLFQHRCSTRDESNGC